MVRFFNNGIECDVNGNPLHPPRGNDDDDEFDFNFDIRYEDDEFDCMFDIRPQPPPTVVVREGSLDFDSIFDCAASTCVRKSQFVEFCSKKGVKVKERENN
jgi:hypothetical protein